MARLLLLDDEATTLEWMSAAIRSLGHEVRAFASGREALAAIDTWRPDLVISDLLMPEMDGFTFARLLRAHGGPPVMFISIATKRAEAVLAGAVGYVQKPATASEVRARVEAVLGRDTKRARILVVEDEADTRELYRMFLEPRFEVDVAEDGLVGLSRLHTRPYDLVITDIHMPNMNGVELIRAMRADANLETIPVIVETSDRGALASPIWRELDVAHRVDKLEFVRWLAVRIDARLSA